MRILLTVVFLVLVTTNLIAQNPSESHLGTWYTYGSHHRLSERFSINPCAELRFYETSSNYNLAFVSIRGNYHISNNETIGLGYAYLDIDTVFEFDHQPNVHEHRVYEQYAINHNISKLNIQHRARFEQRFLDFSNRNELQNRFRYRLSLKYNLSNTIFINVLEEPFVNFQDQAFHENRFYTGFGFKVTKHSQLQIGYLKQHIRKHNLNRIQIGISFKTDRRKPSTTLVQL
ncbi:hypothetical protein BWZ20_14710 [Winogradskyella sp. J14-2]|uniref:DUF2490 domain-containing protein n=1 Tax=Winogradskyella sp. J14-2 TaxID=1936080 RepID=UPI000972AE32|nr:DUF2490 domain-containing protein [Winogradskyella sp. J14-2]APY09477.1 hypothetical protein BWZ20_14710 [Winogradskyella sp. J14-2]